MTLPKYKRSIVKAQSVGSLYDYKKYYLEPFFIKNVLMGKIILEQIELFKVPSPCIGICDSDKKGYCKGCMRNRAERFEWLSMTPSQQLHVIKLCRQRYYRKHKKIPIETDAVEDDPQQTLF